jgi:tRNA (guanine37-N1)-methyltransferase
MLRIDIITLFPEMFAGALDQSIISRAVDKELVTIRRLNPRDFATDKHRTTDDRPFGGGAGMVMKTEPLAATLDRLIEEGAGRRRGEEAGGDSSVAESTASDSAEGEDENLGETDRGLPMLSLAEREEKNAADERAARRGASPAHIVFLTPTGRRFTQDVAAGFARHEHLILVCGRYEGIDERVLDEYADDEISIGDYVLSGGEPAAIVVVDAVVRLLPGALGHADSAADDSFSPGRDGLLDHPHYTRPEVWRGRGVPDVLLSGHHAKVAEWRRQQSLRLTFERRPELLAGATLTKKEAAFVAAMEAERAAAAGDGGQPPSDEAE